MKRILLGLMMMSGLSLMAASRANAVANPSFCGTATTPIKYYSFQIQGAEPSVATTAAQNLPLAYVAGVGVLEFGPGSGAPNYTCDIVGGEMIYMDNDYIGFYGGPTSCSSGLSTRGTPCFDGQAGGPYTNNAWINGTVAPGPNGSQTLSFAATFGFAQEGGVLQPGNVTLPFTFTAFPAASGATLVGNSVIPVSMHADPILEGGCLSYDALTSTCNYWASPYGDTLWDFADNLPCAYFAQAKIPFPMISGCGGGPDPGTTDPVVVATLAGSILFDSGFTGDEPPALLGTYPYSDTSSYFPSTGPFAALTADVWAAYGAPPEPTIALEGFNAVESVSPAMTFIAQEQKTTTFGAVPTAYGAAPYIGNQALLCSGFGGPTGDTIASGQATQSDEAVGGFGATSGSLTIFSAALTGGAAFGSLSFNSNDDIGNTTGIPNYDCDFQQYPYNLYADGTSNNLAIVYDENFPLASATCRDADGGLVKTDGSTYPLDVPGGSPTSSECTGTCENGEYLGVAGGPNAVQMGLGYELVGSQPIGAFEVNSQVVWGSANTSQYTIVTGVSSPASPFSGTLTYAGETAMCTGILESATPGTLTVTPASGTVALSDTGYAAAAIATANGSVTETAGNVTITMAGALPADMTPTYSGPVTIAGVVCPVTTPSSAADPAKFDGTYTVTSVTPAVVSPPSPASFTYYDGGTFTGTPTDCHSGTATVAYPESKTETITLTNTSEGECSVSAAMILTHGTPTLCNVSMSPAEPLPSPNPYGYAVVSGAAAEGDTVNKTMTITCTCTSKATPETDTYALYIATGTPTGLAPALYGLSGETLTDTGACPQLAAATTPITVTCAN